MKMATERDHRIRIVYLIDTISCSTSGTEKQLLETIRKFDKTIIDVYLVCLWQSDWMTQNELPCPCTVLKYEGFLKKSFFRVLRELRNFIFENKIKIVHTFFEDSIFVAWLSTRFSKRNIILLSSRRDMGLDRENMLWYHQLFCMVRPYVNRNFDGIVANSQRIKEYVVKREKTPCEKIKVIYNGVALPEKTKLKPYIIRQYSVDIWIAIVASLVPVKRHDLLIKAIALLCKKIDKNKVKVLVLGTGQEKDNLINLTQKLGVQDVFQFVGAVKNVTAYLQHTDIGVLCSDKEGLSNAILEYMACGLPVVTTAVGGCVELVDENNGRCVPANDPVMLANALHELITDKQKRVLMGFASRKRVIEHFSWQESLLHLEGYYRKLIEEKGVENDL